MSDYVIATLETIAFLKGFNGLTTGTGDMIVYRMIRRFEDELNAYLLGDREPSSKPAAASRVH